MISLNVAALSVHFFEPVTTTPFILDIFFNQNSIVCTANGTILSGDTRSNIFPRNLPVYSFSRIYLHN